MKVLRHEEFEKGCEAACNGPYDGRWSKTMVGYGPEDSHFVVELTYNYNIGQYKLGNDFHGITIQSSEALTRAKSSGWPVEEFEGRQLVRAPDGYPFYLVDLPQPAKRDPVISVAISVSSPTRSIAFWASQLNLQLLSGSRGTTSLGYPGGAALVLVTTPSGSPVEHAKAAGRIAFSCPAAELPSIESAVKEAWGEKAILKSLVSLDTPGKATVQVCLAFTFDLTSQSRW